MSNLTEKLLENAIYKQNPWWVGGTVFDQNEHLLKRDAFKRIQSLLGNTLITALTGLRRTGKTTLIKQIISEFLERGVNSKTILYFSFEESALSQHSEVLERIIEFQHDRFPKEKLYFFFDEIQYVDYWNSLLKRYFDYGWQIKFVITGSSSLFIKTKARESLAGRILEYKLQTLSFSEYLRFSHGLIVSTLDPFSTVGLEGFKNDLESNFLEYLSFGEFPFLLELKNFSERKQYLLDWIVGKIVQGDLPKVKRIVHTPSVAALVEVLISGSGQLVELQNLASDLGINRKTLSEYLDLLEETKLFRQIYNLSSSFRVRSVRVRKVYCSSVNILVHQVGNGHNLGYSQVYLGQAVENFVANYLAKQEGQVYIWRERQKEVDFIWERGVERIPVEVKFQNQIHPSDLKNILNLCKKHKLTKGIIVTKDKTGEENFGEVKLEFIPAHFLVG